MKFSPAPAGGSDVSHKLGISYGSMAFFLSILHNVFLLYHVETFVSVYKIDKVSFWIGETIFLVWNSFNDPLFGWISDKKYLTKTASVTDVVLQRLRALSFNGPLLSVTFLLFWVSWGYPAVQFVVCLCLYDGFLTMIDLHHSALLADMAVSAETRTQLNWYTSVGGAAGALSVFLSYKVWSRENMGMFQMFCVILSMISLIGFIVATRTLQDRYVCKVKSEDSPPPSPRTMVEPLMSSEKQALKSYILQLASHKNFLWFSLMNLVQVFHCHFNSNFFPLFLDNLLGDSISSTTGSVLLGMSFVAPHINNMYFLTLCRKYGVYRVIHLLFCVKLILSFFMWFMGSSQIWLLCLFIASNRVFTEGTCKLLNLVISDLVDEDYVVHGRQQAVSALMFGTAAFVSKPGQTFAPLIGTWLLAIQTGHDIFASGNADGGSIKLSSDSLDVATATMQREGVFHLLIYIPIGCALLQLLAWSQFNLCGKRLQWIKHVRQGAQYSFV